MTIVLHIVQCLFALFACGLLATFANSQRIGVLLAAFAYGGGAYASYAMVAWWPLLAAFAAAWMLRLLGFDPNSH